MYRPLVANPDKLGGPSVTGLAPSPRPRMPLCPAGAAWACLVVCLLALSAMPDAYGGLGKVAPEKNHFFFAENARNPFFSKISLHAAGDFSGAIWI